MPSTPAKRSIDSFFAPASASKRAAIDDEVTQPKRNKPNSKQDTVLGKSKKDSKVDKGKGKAKQEEEIETLMLSDDDEEGEDRKLGVKAESAGQEEEDDDIIIEEPQAGSSKPTPSTSKSAATKTKRPSPPIASIFKAKPPTTPSSAKKYSRGAESVKSEDTKPDVKPSPTKMLSIFDTASASASTSTDSNPDPSTSASLPSQPLDTPLFSFSPDPSFFAPHSRTPFSYLTSALVLLSSTKSRLLIQQVLTNLLRAVIELDPNTLESVVYLLSNKIGPTYEEGTELGVGWQVLSKAIKETSGATSQKLKALSNKLGDPGDIAFEASKSVRLLLQPSPLMCHSVYATLLQIAKLKGTGVLAQKTSLVKKLLLSAQGEQVRYIVRILVSNLRIGAVRLTLLTALARSFCLSRPPSTSPKELEDDEFWITEEEREVMQKVEVEELIKLETKAAKKKKGKKGAEDNEEEPPAKSKIGTATSLKTKPLKDRSEIELRVEAKLVKAVQVVRKVWARHPNFGHLCKALLEGGLVRLEERVGLSVGIPLEPMLGSITRSLPEIYTRLSSRPFVSEAKLDGQRGQIHVWVSDPSLNEPSRPPGVRETSGMFFSGQDVGESKVGEQLKGKKVWVRLFSRHLEDMTQKYPDLIGTVAALVARQSETYTPLKSFIIDCEVVAIDPNTGEFKTFQELSYRSKKDVELGDIKVRVGIFCFDLMLINGESLLSTPFRHRREILRTVFAPLRPNDPRFAKWELIPCCLENDLEKVREFFDECLGMKAEGIMVKLLDEAEIDIDNSLPTDADQFEDLDETGSNAGTADEEEDKKAGDTVSGSEGEAFADDSSPKKGKGKEQTGKTKGSKRKLLPATYEPDKRAMSWLKVKKDYMEDLGDSLDLVPIGAYYGSGRKKDWWSPFLLACYDEDTGTYTAVTKCLSGFTDAFYKSMREKYSPNAENPLTSHERWPEVEAGSLNPDIWFKPSEVWEIRGADFTLSPVYPAAQALLGERGCSIRFPRFIKIRDDKSIENATTAEQLAALYRKQGEKPVMKKVEEVEEEE
ncbi:uncharacterized protein JCM6883_005363 [Sporobolomyces salmoneus]|uniref:uncharacterized protein n=1 Tax=Sporobolomyces salmoneus TaxID=183962 RepID=UPI00317515EA